MLKMLNLIQYQHDEKNSADAVLQTVPLIKRTDYKSARAETPSRSTAEILKSK